MRTFLAVIVAAGALFALSAKTEWKAIKPSRAGDKAKIVVKDKPITYYRLGAATPIEAKVNGKTRLKVYVRCDLPGDAKPPVKYAFQASLDGKEPVTFEATAVPSKVAKYEGAGAAVPGDPDSFYVDVPAGEHTVTLTVPKDSKETVNVRLYTPKKAKKKAAPKEPGNAPAKEPGK